MSNSRAKGLNFSCSKMRDLSHAMGPYTVSTGKQFPTFRKTVAPQLQGQTVQSLDLVCGSITLLRNAVNTTLSRNIVNDLLLHENPRQNLKSFHLKIHLFFLVPLKKQDSKLSFLLVFRLNLLYLFASQSTLLRSFIEVPTSSKGSEIFSELHMSHVIYFCLFVCTVRYIFSVQLTVFHFFFHSSDTAEEYKLLS